MKKILGVGIAACLASAASFTSTAHAVEVPEVSGPPINVQPGEERKSKRLRNGKEVVQVGRLIDGNTLEVSRDDGCTWTIPIDDRYAPSLTWKNCSKSAWGTGKAVEIKKEGQLWPFKVGNKVRYKYKAVNSKGKTNKNAFRNCQVTDKVVVTAGGKEYPSYKVQCKEHSGTRTYYYAPSAETTVYYERIRKKGGKDTMEFIEQI